MEDELILADLGVERRLERLEKDLKKGRSAELEKERDLVHRCQRALEEGAAARARTHRRGSETAPWLSVSVGEAVVARHQSRRSRLERCRSAVEGADKSGLTGFLAHAATRAVALCAKIELEIAQLEGDDAKAFFVRSR